MKIGEKGTREVGSRTVSLPAQMNQMDLYKENLLTLGYRYRKEVVGHLPREISRFCRFSCDYGGELSASVGDLKYCVSPIPQSGLEIPIALADQKETRLTGFSRQ